MQRISSLLIGMLSSGLLAACGGAELNEGDLEQPDAASTPTAVKAPGEGVEVLHDFSANGTEYRVFDAAGTLVLMAKGNRHTGVPVLRTESIDRPTILEIYKALQPEGTPDERLVAAHVETAIAQGRADSAVRHTRVDLEARVEKTEADCINTALWEAFYDGLNIIGSDGVDWNDKSTTIMPSGGYITSAPGAINAQTGYRRDMSLALCNYHPNAWSGEWFVGWSRTGTAAWVDLGTYFLNADEFASLTVNGNNSTRKNLRFHAVALREREYGASVWEL